MLDINAHVERRLGESSVSDRTAVLRFATCGSVDDGKSSLIGRLLYDAELLPDDQLAGLARESQSRPCGPEGLDLSLVVDGLESEREQGITIDVAYRYFATPRRTFIVADSPGHEQYTRNMATAASNVDAAIVLIDSRKGVLVQTRRHTNILSLFGVSHIAAVINKMDLIDYDEAKFREIASTYQAFAHSLGITEVSLLPVSALSGDNVVRRSSAMPWYRGPTLVEWLETVEIGTAADEGPFRMPVQWVNRPDASFRGYSGQIFGGRVRPGDPIIAANSGQRSSVARVVTFDGDLPEAKAGQSVTLVFADEIDVSRGTVITGPEELATVADQFAANVVWFGEEPMIPERSYLMRLGTSLVPAAITDLKYRLNVNTLEHVAAKTLHTNEVGFCNIAADHAVVFDPYHENREMGSFILIDRVTSATVGAGTIEFGLRRATNLSWQTFDTDRAARASQKGQHPAIIWLTGLSGAGKSTIANLAERKLSASGHHVYILDGDNIRHGLNKDLGFTDADRVENIRRVAEVARLMADAGLIVIVSLISPFQRERQMAREIVGEVPFLEIFVDTPIEVCEARDPKGLYRKARAGLMKNFTGIDSVYEPPNNPELRLVASVGTPESVADELINALVERSLI